MYAGVVAYKFQTGVKIKDINFEVDSNKHLRSKIGLTIVDELLTRISKVVFFYFSILSKYINFRKIKRMFK